MPLPLPQNCRFDKERNGVAFTVEIDGREWKAFITSQAIAALYADQDLVRAVSDSSEITRKVAERLTAGDDIEPITLTSTMFDDKHAFAGSGLYFIALSQRENYKRGKRARY